MEDFTSIWGTDENYDVLLCFKGRNIRAHRHVLETNNYFKNILAEHDRVLPSLCTRPKGALVSSIHLDVPKESDLPEESEFPDALETMLRRLYGFDKDTQHLRTENVKWGLFVYNIPDAESETGRSHRFVHSIGLDNAQAPTADRLQDKLPLPGQPFSRSGPSSITERKGLTPDFKDLVRKEIELYLTAAVFNAKPVMLKSLMNLYTAFIPLFSVLDPAVGPRGLQTVTQDIEELLLPVYARPRNNAKPLRSVIARVAARTLSRSGRPVVDLIALFKALPDFARDVRNELNNKQLAEIEKEIGSETGFIGIGKKEDGFRYDGKSSSDFMFCYRRLRAHTRRSSTPL